jgi:hypothetical protein
MEKQKLKMRAHAPKTLTIAITSLDSEMGMLGITATAVVGSNAGDGIKIVDADEPGIEEEVDSDMEEVLEGEGLVATDPGNAVGIANKWTVAAAVAHARYE